MLTVILFDFKDVLLKGKMNKLRLKDTFIAVEVLFTVSSFKLRPTNINLMWCVTENNSSGVIFYIYNMLTGPFLIVMKSI